MYIYINFCLFKPQEFCRAIQSCTTREKCEEALDERGFPTGMPSRHTPPECPEGEVRGKLLTFFHSRYQLATLKVNVGSGLAKDIFFY